MKQNAKDVLSHMMWAASIARGNVSTCWTVEVLDQTLLNFSANKFLSSTMNPNSLPPDVRAPHIKVQMHLETPKFAATAQLSQDQG